MSDEKNAGLPAEAPIEAPSSQLPPIVILILLGLIIGVGLISLDIAMERRAEEKHEKPAVIWRIVGHIGTAVMVATCVGIGIDRLFHHEHLTVIASSLETKLNAFEVRRRIDLAAQLKKNLSDMVAGKTLEHIRDEEKIYARMRAKLEEYPCVTQTMITHPSDPPSSIWKEYYMRKVELTKSGRVISREVLSPHVCAAIKEHLGPVETEKAKLPYLGVAEISGGLGSFANFCIFQRRFDEYDDAYLMLGWFSDPQAAVTSHQHSCIATEHPHLVRMFHSYFEILARSAGPYGVEQVAAATLETQPGTGKSSDA